MFYRRHFKSLYKKILIVDSISQIYYKATNNVYLKLNKLWFIQTLNSNLISYSYEMIVRKIIKQSNIQ